MRLRRNPLKVWLVGAGFVGCLLAGCGGSGDTTTIYAPPPHGSTPEKQYDGTLPPGVTDEPDEALVAEWPERWCEVEIGDSREQVSRVMGAVPTKAGSTVMAHIPYVHLNAQGENENEAPPPAAGADTWATGDPYLFNAFYDESLHVQQLDFAGPDNMIPCSDTRIR